MVYDLKFDQFWNLHYYNPLGILSYETVGLSFVERSINSTESMNKYLELCWLLLQSISIYDMVNSIQGVTNTPKQLYCLRDINAFQSYLRNY